MANNAYMSNGQSHAGAIAAVAGLAALGIGGAVYVLNKQKSTSTVSGQVASISLAAQPTTVQPGGTVDFSAVAYDASNQPVEGASLILDEVTTGTTSSPATTDSTGTAAWSVTFPDTTEPGNYVFVAESD